MTPKSKFSSRKYRIAQQCIALSILIPILFKKLEISDGITQNVLIQIGALGITYAGMNILGKKWGETDG